MTATAPPVTLYTTRDVADMFQLESTNRIDRAVTAGRIPHQRIGRTIRFTAEDVKAAYRILFEPRKPAEQSGGARRDRSTVDLSGVAVSARSRRRHAGTPG
jgi:hypothetical protein